MSGPNNNHNNRNYNHNHNQPIQQPYEPGEVRKFDGWKYQCYCRDDPPPEEGNIQIWYMTARWL